ncbi:ABC transporter six-transmembrane domain-containing protein [Vibrio gallaecicus]|uniref:ABC transporter six-transmembrane domain-containing protein n=1 Tax=Vibrio gallaecicus TaxID=552386 RepID=UPI0010C9C968|nr:ABC transporter six-transmembrane domain-containing protein [Vibrio gallaecicus]MDN3616691.1 ABC transporter six-transmembrane domain-containing protein [Vibrio gallaecicus]
MPDLSHFTVRSILKQNKSKVAITWFLVALENLFMVLLPLFIGFAIDDLVKGEFSDLYWLSALIVSLIVVSVIRRFYDTRIYGRIRVIIGEAVDIKMRNQLPPSNSVSIRNARLDMSRELVDFLENDVPPLMTAGIQLTASIIILSSFHISLGISAIIAGITMLVIYSQFHPYFTRLNRSLNHRIEQQVSILSRVPFRSIRRHLERIKRREVLISDAEAIVYGLIFFVLFSFVITNLWLSTQLIQPTAGQLFSAVTYSLEFLEAAILLPITLQTLSRLTDISQRLNQQCQISSCPDKKSCMERKPYLESRSDFENGSDLKDRSPLHTQTNRNEFKSESNQ